MQKYSHDSRLEELLTNPLANDIINDFIIDKGLPDKIIERERLKKLTAKQLKILVTPLFDESWSEQYIDIINDYDEQLLDITSAECPPTWWKEAVIYRFCDSSYHNLLRKITQLKSLSVDVVWPDITIWTVEEFNIVLRMLHNNGIKVIVTANNNDEIINQINCGIDGVVVCPTDNGEIHSELRRLNTDTFGKYNGVVSIGYIPNIGLERAKLMTTKERNELNMVFGHIGDVEKPYSLYNLKRYLLRWQQLPGSSWGGIAFDFNTRMLHRLQPRWLYRERVAELLAVLMMTMRGTPIIKQGQELGLSTECATATNDEIECGTIDCYQSLTELRKENKGLVYGDFIPVFKRAKDYFAYFRQYRDERYFIECNLTEHPISRRGEIIRMTPLYCSYGDFTSVLRPYESNIYRITG